MLFLIKLVFGFVAVLIGFSVHEFAHAAMAYRMGDPTQKYEGRLTLNPLVHVDWVGAAALLLSLTLTGGRCIVGWGKPVAINAESLNDPIVDGGVCSFAGPFANFLLALCAGLPVKFGLFASLPMVAYFLTVLASVNIALFIFNMIPFPPLDGWKFLQVFVPRNLAYKMRDWETSIGSAPMYVFMAVVVIFGPRFLGPVYMALLGLLVGQLPS
ncbi:MAG: site-2 protease family protein [Candidatus Bruticola sp.]